MRGKYRSAISGRDLAAQDQMASSDRCMPQAPNQQAGGERRHGLHGIAGGRRLHLIRGARRGTQTHWWNAIPADVEENRARGIGEAHSSCEDSVFPNGSGKSRAPDPSLPAPRRLDAAPAFVLTLESRREHQGWRMHDHSEELSGASTRFDGVRPALES
jgi:hypothetical protein